MTKVIKFSSEIDGARPMIHLYIQIVKMILPIVQYVVTWAPRLSCDIC